MSKYRGQLLLILAALIWGSAYIFQKMGMDYVEPFTFNFMRFAVGSIALLPVMVLFDKRRKRNKPEGSYDSPDALETRGRQMVMGSLLCGITQFAAAAFQQIGLEYTTAGKAGFITSMHIVIVPILLLFLRKTVGRATWFGVVLAAFGMYFLCITEGFHLQLGDGLVFGCAVVYAAQILIIDYYAVRVEPIRLAIYQFAFASIASGICMILLESISIHAVLLCATPILYTGLLEVGAAYTLQIFGQQTTKPAVSAIILSMEAVFSVICGALFLHEQLTGRETFGCLLMLCAFLLTQLAGLKGKENQESENRD